jgi:hypothetical protein
MGLLRLADEEGESISAAEAKQAIRVLLEQLGLARFPRPGEDLRDAQCPAGSSHSAA